MMYVCQIGCADKKRLNDRSPAAEQTNRVEVHRPAGHTELHFNNRYNLKLHVTSIIYWEEVRPWCRCSFSLSRAKGIAGGCVS